MMVAQWAKWRDRVSLDIALVFGTLALLILVERTLRLVHAETPWVRPLGLSVLLAHPYLLLRVVSHFRPISKTVMRVALAGLLASVAAVWISVWPVRSPATAALAFAYFIWLLAYVALVFRRGAIAAGGVTHWRMLHAGWGALLLAVVFALAVVVGLLVLQPAPGHEAVVEAAERQRDALRGVLLAEGVGLVDDGQPVGADALVEVLGEGHHAPAAV